MSEYEIILFDLDGTLTDSMLGITKSVQYALKHFGIIENDMDKLTRFIGPPLKESFQIYYHFSDTEAESAIMKYREYYKVQGIFENEVYPMIPELLAELYDNGRQLILATSKPTIFASEILKHFCLDKYFSFISGSNLDGSQVTKSDVITYAIEKCGLNDLEKIVMTGDRKHDILGAKQTGIASIGVLYGYGSLEEIEAECPTHIVKDVPELRKLLLG